MRLHVVNPNSSRSMTVRIDAAARAAAPPGVRIETDSAPGAPPAIEGVIDGARAAPGVLDRIAAAAESGADAHLIACFDDTGLDAARALARAPVIGIGEAACHAAAMRAERFAIVTSVRAAVPVLRCNVARYGFAGRCVAIRAAGVPVLEIDAGGRDALDAIRRATERALRRDEADVIVLGCAGMADLAARLAREFNVPVIEGIAAGVGFATALARLEAASGRAQP